MSKREDNAPKRPTPEGPISAAAGPRLAGQGVLIDRSKPVAFFLNGESLVGFEGDSLASALLSLDRAAAPRSPRLGRARGL